MPRNYEESFEGPNLGLGRVAPQLGEAALGFGETADSYVDRHEEADSLPEARVVCLDLDDFLVDAGRQLHAAHLQIWRNRNGGAQTVPKEFSDEAWRAIGGKGEEVFRRLWPAAPSEEHASMLADFRSIVRADQAELEPLEGVPEGTRRLHESGMRLAIITNRSVKVVETLQAAGIDPDLFDFIFAQGEGHRTFTDKADALRQIAEHTGVRLEEIVMGGDAEGDVEAGREAGTQRLGIPRYGASVEQLYAAGAHRVFANFTQMVEWLLRYRKT